MACKNWQSGDLLALEDLIWTSMPGMWMGEWI